MQTGPDIIKQFEQLYKCSGGNLNSNMQDVYKIYIELKKVRSKLIKAENNFLSLHINAKPEHSIQQKAVANLTK